MAGVEITTEVVGIRDAVKELKKLEPALFKEFRKELRWGGRPLILLAQRRCLACLASGQPKQVDRFSLMCKLRLCVASKCHYGLAKQRFLPCNKKTPPAQSLILQAGLQQTVLVKRCLCVLVKRPALCGPQLTPTKLGLKKTLLTLCNPSPSKPKQN